MYVYRTFSIKRRVQRNAGQNNQISVFQVSGRLFEVRRLFETESLCY